MNIILFGATGMIGQRIYAESSSRGHSVTVFARPNSEVRLSPVPAKIVTGDLSNPADVARAVEGQSAAISALAARGEIKDFLPLNQSLIAGIKKGGVHRLLVVGGAGSLEVAPGLLLQDTPEFPKEWLGYAKIHTEVLNFLKTTDLDWTYISPPALIQPGKKTGRYRRGEDKLLVDDKGKSEISAEDYAVALVDELETPRAIRKRVTVAW
jgi:putative NADH-flavin reductase